MTDDEGYIAWRRTEASCPGVFARLDAALAPQAIAVARAIGSPPRAHPTRAWLDARGFTAVVLPDYITHAVAEPLQAWLRRWGVTRCFAYADYRQFRPIDFIQFDLTHDHAIANVALPMFLHETLVFDLDQSFALYESEADYHLVAGPEGELETMIGMSFEQAAAQQSAERQAFAHRRGHIPALLRDLGGPQARLMGFV